jgi:hypothetical protein
MEKKKCMIYMYYRRCRNSVKCFESFFSSNRTFVVLKLVFRSRPSSGGQCFNFTGIELTQQTKLKLSRKLDPFQFLFQNIGFVIILKFKL